MSDKESQGEDLIGDAEPSRRRRRSRSRSRSGDPQPLRQVPFTRLKRPFAPTEVVDGDRLEAIHEASLNVLESVGMDVLEPAARDILAKAGCRVEDERVRFDPEVVSEAISQAPDEFTLHARNRAHDVQIGGDNVVFTAVGSPPNVGDVSQGRRTGNQEDFQNLVRLTQHFNAVHMHAGYPVEPADLHPSVRHLHATFDLLTLSDKVINAYSLGRQRNEDCLEMVRIARNISHEQLLKEPSVHTVINTSSPLRLDIPMCQGIIEHAKYGQVSIITPFTLMGAMAPITVAGAITLSHAEAMAAITLGQLTRPGAPMCYGTFTSNVDMKSGAPAFGTPEHFQASLAAGQLARKIGLPWRCASGSAANLGDAQAANETQLGTWGCLMAGATVTIHSAGWLEGGLTIGYEKIITDVEVLQMVAELCASADASDDAIGLEALREVEPQGHFFATSQTMRRYDTEFYAPLVHDWANFGTWSERGSLDASTRATKVWQEIVDAPAVATDADAGARLEKYIAKRTAHGGAAPVS